MQTFDLCVQGRSIVARNYREDGEHRGAVAVVSVDAARGVLVRVSKPIPLEAVAAILDRVRAEHADDLDRWQAEAIAAAAPPDAADETEAPPDADAADETEAPPDGEG